MADVELLLPTPESSPPAAARYGRRMAAELRALGWRVTLHDLDGAWPAPAAPDRRRALETLAALPHAARVVADGAVLAGVADGLRERAAQCTLIGVFHRAEHATDAVLAELDRIVTVNGHVAERLVAAGADRDRIAVRPPGVDPAPLGDGSGGPGVRLLTTAPLTPEGGHDVLLHALAGLGSRPWALDIAAPATDTRHAGAMRRLCTRLQLDDRVRLHEQAMPESCWHNADLFAHPARDDPDGDAVVEAAAHGLPAIVAANAVAADRLPEGAGLLVEPADIGALHAGLARVLDDGELFARLASGARAARGRLLTWPEAAAGLAEDLTHVGS